MLAELAQILSYNSLSVYTLQFTFSCNSLVLDPGLFVCLAGYKCMSKNASNKLKSSQTNHTYPSLEHFVLAKNMIKCYIIEEVVDIILGGLSGIFQNGNCYFEKKKWWKGAPKFFFQNHSDIFGLFFCEYSTLLPS